MTTLGPHYDAEATMVVPNENSFYILFPAKGIMSLGKSFLIVSMFI